MTARRVLAMVIGACGPLGAFALLLGNQWIDEWFQDVGPRPGFGSLVLRWLRFPSWRIGDERGSFSYQLIFDIGVLLFLGLLALLIFLGARGLDPERGTAGAFILGWWATAAAGAVAGLIRNLLWISTDGLRGGDLVAFGFSDGATFGIGFGWLMGLGAMAAYLVTRPKTPPQPSGVLPPQHPASAPYVPPARQRAWTPPPASPGAGPSGGYPAPPPPHAQPLAHQPPPPPAPAPSPAPEPEPAAQVDTSDAVAMAEPAQPAAPDQAVPDQPAPDPAAEVPGAQEPAQPEAATPEQPAPEPAPSEPATSKSAPPETVMEVPAAQERATPKPAMSETVVEVPAAQERVAPETAPAEADVAAVDEPEGAAAEDAADRPSPSETVVLRAAASREKGEAVDDADSAEDEDDRPLPPPT